MLLRLLLLLFWERGLSEPVQPWSSSCCVAFQSLKQHTTPEVWPRGPESLPAKYIEHLHGKVTEELFSGNPTRLISWVILWGGKSQCVSPVLWFSCWMDYDIWCGSSCSSENNEALLTIKNIYYLVNDISVGSEMMISLHSATVLQAFHSGTQEWNLLLVTVALRSQDGDCRSWEVSIVPLSTSSSFWVTILVLIVHCLFRYCQCEHMYALKIVSVSKEVYKFFLNSGSSSFDRWQNESSIRVAGLILGFSCPHTEVSLNETLNHSLFRAPCCPL